MAGAPAQLERLSNAHGEFTWLGLHDPSPDELAAVVEAFHIHELVAEDLLHGNQRIKLEDYGEHEFVVINTLHYDDPTSQVATGELAICLGRHFVLTVRKGRGAELAGVRKALELDPERLAHGAYAVLHAVMDRVVDQALGIAYELENDVAAVEQQVFSDTRSTHTQELYFLKREVIEFRRSVDPMRPVLARLATDPDLAVPEVIRPFFRDIEDHAQRASEQVASLDALIGAAMSADLTQVQLRQNEEVRKISAYAALAAAPTMLAGIYGMNFDAMPELHASWGYPVVLSVMVGFSGFLYWKFKRSGWL